MTSGRVVLILFGLRMIAFGQHAAAEETIPRQRIFISSDKTFEFTAPNSYSIYQGQNVTKGNASYIPLCQDDALVCVVYPGARYRGTNFESAAVEIKLVSDDTAKTCTLIAGHMQERDTARPTRTIGGISFVHYRSMSAAMSNDVETNQYRGFVNAKCYELDGEVSFANFLVYPPGAVKKFTKQDDERVTASLTRIIDSFRIMR